MREVEHLIREFMRSIGCRAMDLAIHPASTDEPRELARLEQVVSWTAKRLRDKDYTPAELVRRALNDEVVRSGMLQMLEPHRQQVPELQDATLRWIWQATLAPALRRHQCSASWLLHGAVSPHPDEEAEQELLNEFLTQRVYKQKVSVLQKCGPETRGPAGLLTLMAGQFISKLHRKRSPLHARAYDISTGAFAQLEKRGLLPQGLAPPDDDALTEEEAQSPFHSWIEDAVTRGDGLTQIARTNLKKGREDAAKQLAELLAASYRRVTAKQPLPYAPPSWVQSLLQSRLAVALEALQRSKRLADEHEVKELPQPHDEQAALDEAQLRLWVDELLAQPDPEDSWNERVAAALDEVLPAGARTRRERVMELHRRTVAGMRAYLRHERARRSDDKRADRPRAPDPKLLLAAWLDCLPSGAEIAALQGELGLKQSQVYLCVSDLKKAWIQALTE